MTEWAVLMIGTAGVATHIPNDPKRWPASVAAWFLHCPGQAAAWDDYILSVVHLREQKGVPAPNIRFPGATHEVVLVALDPDKHPTPENPRSWRHLLPVNVSEQVVLPDDAAAASLIEHAVKAVVDGLLWAEPPLSGQREPWKEVLNATAAHLRGEHNDA